LFFRRLRGINRPPVHGDSVIATISAGTDFNFVSRNADTSDLTTLDVGDDATVLPTTDSLYDRMGDFCAAVVEQPRGLDRNRADPVRRRDSSRTALMPVAVYVPAVSPAA
jgi:hypothetical protein